MKNGTYKVVIKNDNESWYDSNGNIIHYKNSNGYEWWQEYDSNGNCIHSKNSNGYEWWREYDSNGNMIHSKNSDGYESWIEYDSDGNVIHYKDSNGIEFWYDSDGKEISKEKFVQIHGSCDGRVVTIEGKIYQLTQLDN
jgi:YD repeat-containing protein